MAKAVKEAFGAEKMNYECLGNGDIHLHFHLFPRVSGDLVNTATKAKVLFGGCRKELCGIKRIFPICVNCTK